MSDQLAESVEKNDFDVDALCDIFIVLLCKTRVEKMPFSPQYGTFESLLVHTELTSTCTAKHLLDFSFFFTCVSRPTRLTKHCATLTRREQAGLQPCCVHAGLSCLWPVEWKFRLIVLTTPPLQLLNSSSPLFKNRGTTMLWDKLCWLLALLALSSAGLPPPNDPLSTPRIFLSFKGKTPDDWRCCVWL